MSHRSVMPSKTKTGHLFDVKTTGSASSIAAAHLLILFAGDIYKPVSTNASNKKHLAASRPTTSRKRSHAPQDVLFRVRIYINSNRLQNYIKYLKYTKKIAYFKKKQYLCALKC